MDPLTIAVIIGLVASVILHELGHAYAATWLGDPTARLEGRLSPNPLVHIDPMMSVIVPAILVMTNSPFLFGAAKPVPYNPYNFTNQKWGEAIVAAAGPAVNLLLALIFAIVARLGDVLALPENFTFLAAQFVFMNLFLAFFNLMPIPPLDGSKILPRFLPYTLRMQYDSLRRYLEHNIALAFVIVIVASLYLVGGLLGTLTHTVASLLLG